MLEAQSSDRSDQVNPDGVDAKFLEAGATSTERFGHSNEGLPVLASERSGPNSPPPSPASVCLRKTVSSGQGVRH